MSKHAWHSARFVMTESDFLNEEAMMAVQPRCCSCRWFVPDNHLDPEQPAPMIWLGQCRRYPPSLLLDDQEPGDPWSFPVVEECSHCGEHQMRPAFVRQG